MKKGTILVFDRQNWKLRSKSLHNLYARKVRNANSKAHADKLSRDYETYYSVLIELDYFDAIQFCQFLSYAQSFF